MVPDMRTVFTLILVFALGHPSRANGSSSDGANKEIEQMYNKIFSGGMFSPTIAPDTTTQWLEQLELEGDEGKKATVQKLLAFSRIQPDCKLGSGSGNVLMAHHQYFTKNSTPTIKAYIESCLEQMYKQCSDTFVIDTKEAINRLKDSADFGRVSRFKELVAKEFQLGKGLKQKDLSEPMRQFIIEQTTNKRGNKLVFEGLFKQSISELCAIVRREFDCMMYFDVLLTVEQVEALGETVVDWYKVRSVCKEVLVDQQAIEKVFKHVEAKNKEEDAMIDSRYRRIFNQQLMPPLKPDKMLEWINWLDEKLATKLDPESLTRREEVARVIDYTNKVHQCNVSYANILNNKLSYYRRKFTLTLQRYLKHLRDIMFHRCQSEFAVKLKEKEDIIKDSPAIIRLKDLIVKKFDPTSDNLDGLYDKLLEIMDELAGVPLSPEMDRTEFANQFREMVTGPCEEIYKNFYLIRFSNRILRRKLAKQMDPIVRDWFVTSNVCSIVKQLEADQVYERSLARGHRRKVGK